MRSLYQISWKEPAEATRRRFVERYHAQLPQQIRWFAVLFALVAFVVATEMWWSSDSYVFSGVPWGPMASISAIVWGLMIGMPYVYALAPNKIVIQKDSLRWQDSTRRMRIRSRDLTMIRVETADERHWVRIAYLSAGQEHERRFAVGEMVDVGRLRALADEMTERLARRGLSRGKAAAALPRRPSV